MQNLDQLILIFLEGIGARHHVSGNIVYTLADMSYQFKEYQEYTPKQRVYIIQNILENWNHLEIGMRCNLGL